MLLAGSVGGLAISALLAASSGSVLWLVLGPVAVVANITLVASSRRRATREHEPEFTGHTVAPAAGRQEDGTPRSWTGGANMVGALGRMNATSPLAVLTVSIDALSLRLRPAPVAAVFGVERLDTARQSVHEVFPASGRMRASGVGIVVGDDPVAYFWTTDREGVLAALAQYGYPVSWQERLARAW